MSSTATENVQETWETTTGGTVYVQVKDPRQPGGWRQTKVGGKSAKKLRITVEEREFNQELIPEDNQEHDPFLNGLLVRTHPKDAPKGVNELSDADLIEMLQMDSDEVFMEAVKSLASEVVLRRLVALAERHTNLLRLQELQAFVDAKYRVGKTSKVVAEMIADDAKYADADL